MGTDVNPQGGGQPPFFLADRLAPVLPFNTKKCYWYVKFSTIFILGFQERALF